MRRTWTVIGVRDVHASFDWYQSLLGLPQTTPAHDYFGQILDSDGTVLLCLHEWGAHDHPSLTSSDLAQPGKANGGNMVSPVLTTTGPQEEPAIGRQLRCGARLAPQPCTQYVPFAAPVSTEPRGSDRAPADASQ